MSVWRDILSPLPEDAQTVFFRRHPQATPTAWGVWHNEIAGIRAGPNDWEIGHNDIAARRPFTGSVPAYPAPSPPTTAGVTSSGILPPTVNPAGSAGGIRTV